MQYATREELVLSPLPGWEHLPPKQYREWVAALIEQIEAEGKPSGRARARSRSGWKRSTGRTPRPAATRRRSHPRPAFMRRAKRSGRASGRPTARSWPPSGRPPRGSRREIGRRGSPWDRSRLPCSSCVPSLLDLRSWATWSPDPELSRWLCLLRSPDQGGRGGACLHSQKFVCSRGCKP